jgi:uncharacterized membrane protein YsdA (DUF1294 family)
MQFILYELFFALQNSIELFATAIELYLIVINLATFIVFSLDKMLAVQICGIRISESRLLELMRCGGLVGGKCAMQVFNHKTKKKAF